MYVKWNLSNIHTADLKAGFHLRHTAQPRTHLPLMLFVSTYMYKVPICEFGCTTIFVHECHTKLPPLEHLPMMMCSSLSHNITKSPWFRLPQLINSYLSESVQYYLNCKSETHCTPNKFQSCIIIAVQVEFQVDLVDTKLWEVGKWHLIIKLGFEDLQYVLTWCTHR
jgi:hypothetical protein